MEPRAQPGHDGERDFVYSQDKPTREPPDREEEEEGEEERSEGTHTASAEERGKSGPR